MAAIRWWWVRHAPTGLSGAIGWSDPPADLSDAERLDQLRRVLPAAPVIASDLTRARMTAARVAGQRPRWPDEPGLRELHFGAWEGLSFDTIATRFPDDNAAWWADPGSVRVPEGESYADLAARVSAAIDRVHARCGAVPPGGTDIIAVAHMGSILAALGRAAGMSPRQALGFKIDTLSLTRLDWIPAARAWRVVCVNAT